MATQEETNTGMMHLLNIAVDVLREPNNLKINFKTAQNLVSQCFFKYSDLENCTFRDACRERFEEDYECEPEEPIDIRGELD